MSLAQLRESIPDFGRDIRLNLETVLNPENAAGLSPQQLWGVALACAYAVDSRALATAILADGQFDEATGEAARGAATIMAMNNVYYRATHLMGDEELKKLPARLRMNVIGKPGIPKVDFELMSFAVSAISGCGQCMTSHAHELRKAGVTTEGIQSALKIASVINAAQAAMKIQQF